MAPCKYVVGTMMADGREIPITPHEHDLDITFGFATSCDFNRSGLKLNTIDSIIINAKYAETIDERGDTFIPPTLKSFAETFASDLKSVHLKPSVHVGDRASSGSIFLTLGDPSDYRDAAGRETSEGYALNVSSSGITITGASPLGVWWGTRTVLQQASLSNGTIPYGSGIDSPGWATRGMMLDAGRHYYPPEFLIEMCAYMSFFKQNTFHVHLSDNLYNNVDIYSREQSLELYARFRLWSDSKDVAGLNKHKNESYTREQFDNIQSACAARGVTILPEIEAPGHSLVFVQWKPELGLENDLSLLNISNPETIPTMKTVWSTFLPWFHTKTVHIGADEYTAEVNDYNIFVNAMADHIHTESNKTIRIWGTFPPNYTQPGYINIYRNVSVQHWEYFEDNPLYDYIRNKYTVLNSDDTFYVVNKWSGSYPQMVSITKTFNGNPATNNGTWYPYVFDTHNSSNNPVRSEPLVLGEIAPLWNDYGANTSVYTEAYYAWQEGIPALADKQWGGDLTAEELNGILQTLLPSIPGQNLRRSIPSKSSTILEYSLRNAYSSASNRSAKISDQSGNGYDGSTNCPISNTSIAINSSCSLTTPLSSKGRDYTLTLSLLLITLSSPTNATLVSGADSALMLTPNITLFASGSYFRLNSSLPMNQKFSLSILGRGNQTFAKLDDGAEEEFLTKMGINGERFVWAPMGIEAPLKEVGGAGCGWNGELYGMKLTNVA
ncbi:glycoside hydrolase, catalytic core [Lindgomyces ingoldianus]|uniref:Glycoside hydrolase, catalytic core n=1 Tax=Lindgomyces ingoldianus TaxID=673940 RepID=A0ACB6R928_9PLEO|nr:glycoside hydrolase, catalytic core [Lindgomyces ingoldianus]KAF2475017.1 glycoside hydrolase, catalytic core [Lindgomyces ingoldianus]